MHSPGGDPALPQNKHHSLGLPLLRAGQLGALTPAQHTEAPQTGMPKVQTFHGNRVAP